MQIRPAFADGRHVRMGGNGLSPFFATLLCGRDGLGLNTLPIQRTPDNDMTTFSGFARFSGRQSTQRGALWLALVLGAAMFAAGCGKGKSAAPAAGATPRPAQDTNAAPAATSSDRSQSSPVASTDTTTNGQPDLRALNRQFISYELENHTHFKTLEEYETAANVQFPLPPAGKKYAIDRKGYIALVDQ